MWLELNMKTLTMCLKVDGEEKIKFTAELSELGKVGVSRFEERRIKWQKDSWKLKPYALPPDFQVETVNNCFKYFMEQGETSFSGKAYTIEATVDEE